MKTKITLTLTPDQIKSLTRMVMGDEDSADKNSNRFMLWNIAEEAGIIDNQGNLKTNEIS